MIDGDHDIADLLPGLDVPVGLDDLAQRIGSVDHRLELSGLEQFPEVLDHCLVMRRNGEFDSLPSLERREERLRQLIASVREQYDYVFIDSPPSLGLLTLNALVAADAVLIPLHCEYYALEGLADLWGTIRRVRGALNSTLDIEGVLFTMFDERTNLAQQVAGEVRAFFKEKVFRTTIPRNVRLGEAPSHGMPVIQYDPKSKGSEAYVALAREVLERASATTTAPTS